MPYIDLSVAVNNQLPVYPGDSQVDGALARVIAEVR
jgi:kynurenine formamidase